MDALQGYSESDAYLVRMRQEIRDAMMRHHNPSSDAQAEAGLEAARAGDPSFQDNSRSR